MNRRLIYWVLGLCVLGCGDDVAPGNDAAVRCQDASECDDGVFCNGIERCEPDDPGATALGCLPGTPPCSGDDCDESARMCITPCDTPDADGDGADRVECGGDDCDDDDPTRYPGASEICDAAGVDEDCDPSTLGHDMDEDGFVDSACCQLDDSGLRCGEDCDDSLSTVNPSATEACNRIDEDCDSNVDEGALETFYLDMDGDDFGRASETVMACLRPADYANTPGDCDDTDVSVFPGATEICNGEDSNCDGTPDNPPGGCACTVGTAPRPCGPPDGMGGIETRGACMVGTQSCVGGMWGSCEGAVFPSAETCDGVNEDCDGAIDEEAIDRLTFRRDADMDGFGTDTDVVLACPGDPPPGYTSEPRLDCDDADPARNPDEVEVCNDVDEDCDTQTDEAPAVNSCGTMSGHTYACEAGGTCAITGCPSGTLDCDAIVGNGCEEDAANNLDHCGACGNRCDLACVGTSCDDIVSVTAGGGHACGLRASGTVVCWGLNDHGQLGDGTTIRRSQPVAVSGLSSVVAISAGSAHTCASTVAGDLYCWGGNSQGQAGQPPGGDITVPTAVTSVTKVEAVAAGQDHTCVITQSIPGELFCFGDNSMGQLGNDSLVDSSAGRRVYDPDLADPFIGIRDAVAVTAGVLHSCAIRSGGQAICWGVNTTRQLGDGLGSHGAPCDGFISDCAKVPVEVQGLTDATQIATGPRSSHTCARRSSGAIVCWGQNADGRAVDSTTAIIATPTQALAMGDSVSTGSIHTCARTGTTVQCWGGNGDGQLGRSTGGSAPGPVGGLSDAVDIGVGETFGCAVRSAGPTVCWGDDSHTQLGNGDPATDSNTPVTVLPLL